MRRSPSTRSAGLCRSDSRSRHTDRAAAHALENEQFTYILEGALRFLIGADGAEEVVVRAGEVLHLPSNVPHEAHALEDTLDVDVFSPPRQDWLNKTDAYLRRT